MGTGLMAWAGLMLATSAPANDVLPFGARGFNIPITVDAGKRANIRELVLHCSKDGGRTWEMIARTTPDKKAFEFLAQKDGLHYFSIQTIDLKGGVEPPDIYRAPVGLKMDIDTVKPTVRLTGERVGDEVQVSWEAHDERPDWATLKLEYKVGDNPSAGWTPLPVAGGSDRGNYRFRQAVPGVVALRLSMKDKAGNEARADRVVPAAASSHIDRSLSRVAATGMPVQPGTDLSSLPPVLAPDNRYNPVVPPAPLVGSSALPPSPLVGSSANQASPLVGSSGMPTRGHSPEALVVNHPIVKLGFLVSRLGTSGLGSVDVWMTTDEGASWVQEKNTGPVSLPTLADLRNGPAKGTISVNLPREGVKYGFILIPRNQAGVGASNPLAGDVPQVSLELDRTLPVAKLYEPRPDPSRSEILILNWVGNDRNLAPNPVTLEWSATPDGPWNVIGGDRLPNSGQHLWQVPEGTPPKVYLRLTVRDKAGNSGVALTKNPVLVDLVKPILQSVSVER